MRTALVTSYLSHAGGGVSAVVEALSRSLHAMSPDVRVIGLCDSHWQSEALDWRGTPAAALRVRGPSRIGYAPSALRKLREVDASIIHTHGLWSYPSRAVSLWSARTGRPYLVSPHGMLDSWAMRRAPWKKAIAAYLYENTHLRHASCLHALCDAEAQSIRRLRFDNPICIIPNGVMLPVITHDSGPAPWRDRIPADAKVMLFLGRLHRKKNLCALIEAWPENPDAHNWHLVIAGWDQGGHQEALAHLISKRNLNGRILLIGPLFGKLKDSALRNAHAFVLPSLSEGLPMAVLEAWSYGLPILMTDACNLPEGFAASAAARLSLNLDEMVRDLGRFLKKNPTDLQRMGRNGRQLVESRFNWDDVARAFLAVYEWIANGAERPSTVRIM